MEFLHVGMKVNDIHKGVELYGMLFGIEWEPVKEYKLDSITLHGKVAPGRTLVTHGKTASGFEIEMIQTLEGESADDVALKGREGLSHFAFLVDDLDVATQDMVARGLKSVSEFRSEYVDFTFFDGADLGGALVQLVKFNQPRR